METSRAESRSLELAAAARLAEAARRLGGVEALARTWPAWPEFVRGPLTAAFALGELGLLGLPLDVARLLALGPEPEASRPERSLRWALGLTLAVRRLEAWPPGDALTPGLVAEVHAGLDAPQLGRGRRAREDPPESPPGAAVWTLASRWLASGAPPIWAAGLALATWEREGPESPRRGPAGRTLLWGLAPRLGLPAAGLAFLGPGLVLSARRQAQGLGKLTAALRREGAWRRFVEVFFLAAAYSAQRTLELGLAVRALHAEHRELVATWVRAPANPLRLLDLLVGRPVLDLPLVAARLAVTQRTAGLLADKLLEHGLLAEITGQLRGRRFAYRGLLRLLQPGWGDAPGEGADA